MAGYTRQSVADIINGADITAPPLNAEFNQIQAAFNATTGHTHDGSTGNAPRINLQTSVSGYLLPANGGTGGRNNVTAVTDPTFTSDGNLGYAPGSVWINVQSGRKFVCLSNTNSAAVWSETVLITQGNRITPFLTGTVDIGSSTFSFKNLHLTGAVYADSLIGRAVSIDTLSVSGATTLSGLLTGNGGLTINGVSLLNGNVTINGNTTLGDAATDTVNFVGRLSSDLLPNVDDTRDLGSSTNEFRNLWIDGVANIDSLVADTADIDGGTIDNTAIGTIVPNVGTFTNLTANGNLVVNGNTTLGDSAADGLAINAEVTTNIIPKTDDTVDLGSSTKEFRNLWIDGTANIDSLIADTAAISGGSINGTTIGGTTAAAGTFTNLTATAAANLGSLVTISGGAINNTTIGNLTPTTITGTVITANTGFVGNLTGNVAGNVTGNLTGNVTGNVTGNLTGNVTSNGLSTFQDVTINGTLNLNLGTVGTITGLSEPTNNSDAATKSYVDTNDFLKLDKAGGTMTGSVTFTGGAKVTGLPTPTLSSDAATKGYVDTSVANLINAAPGALDTLNELAAALGNDSNFATSVYNSIATKLSLSGGTMTGNIDMGSFKISSLGAPTAAGDATNKSYVDTQDALKVSKAGDTMTGTLDMSSQKITSLGAPTAAADAANKSYVDTQDALKVSKAGDTMTGNLAMSGNKVTGLGAPIDNGDATTKAYVDNILGSSIAAATSAAAAAASQTAAATSEANALSSANLAQDWAIKTSGTVDGTNYSAKYWATQANVGIVATNISSINTAAGSIANVNTVAADIASVNTVAGISANVTTVSGINAAVSTVAGISANVSTVAGVSGNVTTVANSIGSVNTVASNIAAVVSVANDIASVISAANDLNEAVSEIETVAASIANVDSVGTNIGNVNTVSAGIGSVGTVASNVASVNTVAAGIANVNIVAGIAADVTIAAQNVVDFNNRYLGASATAPTTDPNGSALDLGDLYFDTVSNVVKVYGSGGWTTAASAVNGTAARFKYTATAAQTTFTGVDDASNALAYDAGYIDVYMNGVKLVSGTDFTANNGSSIVLSAAANAGDILEVIAYGTFTLANFSINDANDVNTSAGPADGDVLVFSTAQNAWVPGQRATTGKSIAMAIVFGG